MKSQCLPFRRFRILLVSSLNYFPILFRSQLLSTLTDFFGVGEGRIPARCLRCCSSRQGERNFLIGRTAPGAHPPRRWQTLTGSSEELWRRLRAASWSLRGPLFSIFKALTAVKLAEEATAAGVELRPGFFGWLLRITIWLRSIMLRCFLNMGCGNDSRLRSQAFEVMPWTTRPWRGQVRAGD